jgi:DNA recombination protein Rad52
MSFTDEQKKALSADLNRSHVKEREQAGRKLSYIEGWLAIAEANRIFGYDAWTRETFDVKCVAEKERKIGRPPNTRDGWSVSYIAKVRVTVDGVIREGIGSGHGIDADLGLAHESAIKEAETDAMKRALMTFGNPFGLALYDKGQTHVSDVNTDGPLTQEGSTEARDVLLKTIEMAKTGADLEKWKAQNDATINRLMRADFEIIKAAYIGAKTKFKPKAVA